MTFGCNPQINCCLIFRSFSLISYGSISTKAYRHCKCVCGGGGGERDICCFLEKKNNPS